MKATTKPKLSFSLLSKIDKYEKTNDQKYLEEALNYWLGIKEPPNKTMEEGTRVHKLIEAQDTRFSQLDSGRGVRESYFAQEFDEFMVHGIIDLRVEDKIFDYKLSKLNISENSKWSESLVDMYDYQQNIYSLSDPLIIEGYIVKVTKETLKISKLEKLSVEFSKPFIFNEETRSQTLEKIDRHYKVLQTII